MKSKKKSYKRFTSNNNHSERVYLEYKDDTVGKFWEITRDNNKIITRSGNLGTKGKRTTKKYNSNIDHVFKKMINDKYKKGYLSIGGMESQFNRDDTIGTPSSRGIIGKNWCKDLPDDIIQRELIVKTATEDGVITEDSCHNLRKFCKDPTCKTHCWEAPDDIQQDYISVCKEIMKTKRCVDVLHLYINRTNDEYADNSMIQDKFNQLLEDNNGLYHLMVGTYELLPKGMPKQLSESQENSLNELLSEELDEYTILDVMNILNISEFTTDIILKKFSFNPHNDDFFDDEVYQPGGEFENHVYEGLLLDDINDMKISLGRLSNRRDIYDFLVTTEDPNLSQIQNEQNKQLFLSTIAYIQEATYLDSEFSDYSSDDE